MIRRIIIDHSLTSITKTIISSWQLRLLLPAIKKKLISRAVRRSDRELAESTTGFGMIAYSFQTAAFRLTLVEVMVNWSQNYGCKVEQVGCYPYNHHRRRAKARARTPLRNHRILLGTSGQLLTRPARGEESGRCSLNLIFDGLVGWCVADM